MGLVEKRLITEGRTVLLPKYQAELRAIVGSDMTYEIDWDGFVDDLEALMNIEDQGLGLINGAFKAVCSNEKGKKAVKGAVKRITIKNIEDKKKKHLSLSKGDLTIHGAWGHGHDGYHTVEEIRAALEKLL
jgi:hypothetical protein